MKVILSRKGFDSGTGGFASPIIVDNGNVKESKLLSLPIPVTEKQRNKGERGIPYDNLRFGRESVSEIIQQLSNGRFNFNQQAHLDPDLDEDRLINREDKENWQPVFGQTGSAQSHLKNNEVGKGALFLFFGWFKQTKYNNNGDLKYVRGAKNLHIIFGWLQVGKILEVAKDKIPPWLEDHPHVKNKDIDGYKKNNTIYVASDKLSFNGLSDKKGGGVFSNFKPSLQLTAREGPMSCWSLPKWFYPFDRPKREPLTFHRNPKRWELSNEHVLLRSTSPGQEFVLDTDKYPKAVDWLKELFEDC